MTVRAGNLFNRPRPARKDNWGLTTAEWQPVKKTVSNVEMSGIKKRIVKTTFPKQAKGNAKFKITKVSSLAQFKGDSRAVTTTILRVNKTNSEMGGVPFEWLENSPSSSSSTPAVSVVTSNASPSWLSKIFSLGSQVIAGWAPNRTVQTVGGVAPVYNVPETVYQQVPVPVQTYGQQNPYGGTSAGSEIGNGLDRAFAWAGDNVLLLGAVGFGLYLLMKPPPTSKR